MIFLHRFLEKTLKGRLRKLASDKRGATAVEFALILPIMVLLYMWTVEISQAISAQRRVAIVTGMMGDLTAQQETVNEGLLDLIFSAAKTTIRPFSSTQLTAYLTSVKTTSGTPTVVWSFSWTEAGNRVAYLAEGSTFSGLPSDLQVNETSVIVAEIQYNYVSPLTFIFPTSRTLTNKTYFRPRLGKEIPFNSSTASSSTWTVATSGTTGTQIGENYIGFGTEYTMVPRNVPRTSATLDSPPAELTNAWNCYYSQPSCNPGGAGGSGDPGSGGGTGCQYAPDAPQEVYNMEIACHHRERNAGKLVDRLTK